MFGFVFFVFTGICMTGKSYLERDFELQSATASAKPTSLMQERAHMELAQVEHSELVCIVPFFFTNEGVHEHVFAHPERSPLCLFLTHDYFLACFPVL